MVQISSLIAVAASVLSVTAAPSKKDGWENWQKPGWCTPAKQSVRVSYASMAPADRKAYTDAIKCVMNKPSELNHTLYPGATNRYHDYAAIHISQTNKVHLSGFFLTWHRMYTHLFEQDLKHGCGYKGPFPYWDFSDGTDLHNSVVFDGSPYSLSGDGAPNNTGPIPLGPQLLIPHGSGGGCVTTGPFANLITPFAFIDPLFLISGAPLPNTTYNAQPWCLTRDLNSFVQSSYTNRAEVVNTTNSPNAAALEYNFNGVIGGSSLGVHSGAHFEVGGGGGQMGSIHVSVQDPVWWALHTMIDHIYTSWQIKNPSVANQLYGTETAFNAPPSANVTLSTIEPNWGYFYPGNLTVQDLISTTAGPFCYRYDNVIN